MPFLSSISSTSLGTGGIFPEKTRYDSGASILSNWRLMLAVSALITRRRRHLIMANSRTVSSSGAPTGSNALRKPS